jgi:MFS family permease
MGETGTGEGPSRASRFIAASQNAAKTGAAAARAGAAAGKAGASAVGGAGRFVHRLASASGAGRTGLSTLIELSIASALGDAFVVIALAGTLFFSSTAEQARGRAAFALIVTIAPYAVLAPLIGPLLDRVRQGNKYILMGTLLARGLLCWGMAGAMHDPVTLLPAALGVLVLQRAYGVTKSAVTPRLLPRQMTLVAANSRFNLASLITTSVGAVVALGIDHILGDHADGAAWVLRCATVIYLGAIILGFRLPDTVDATTDAAPRAADAAGRASTRPYTVPGQYAGTGNVPGSVSDDAAPQPAEMSQPNAPPRRRRKPFAIPRVGPVVAEAMKADAVTRIFYGFMLSFLAFILRTEKFGHTSDKIALGGLALVIAVGGLIGTGIGSALRARAPQLLMYLVLGLCTFVTIVCAMLFGLVAVLFVTLIATIAQTLVKASLDSILQREIPPETRSSTFAFSETLHQLALVAGGLLGLALSLTNSGLTGLTVAAVGLAIALTLLVVSRRRRIVRSAPARVGAGG